MGQFQLVAESYGVGSIRALEVIVSALVLVLMCVLGTVVLVLMSCRAGHVVNSLA